MSSTIIRANPFPGIRSYEMHESEMFFGREKQVAELIRKLTPARFLAIVGSSGCGKSSLIKAGLVPALIRNGKAEGSQSWKVCVFRPGDDPIGNLAGSLTNQKEQANLLATRFRSGEGRLSAAEIIPPSEEHDSLLLVIDQFEELFRFKKSRTAFRNILDASLFVELILQGLNDATSQLYVVLSMRTDFLDDCTEFRGLSEAINEGSYLVPRMNREERQLAIEGPVARSGGAIAPELVERLLDEVGDDPDQLPIMQHAMMRTWEYWSLHRIGDEPIQPGHYEAVGTMKEALHVHLEEIFTDLRDERARTMAEKLFKSLTDVSRESRGTRRPTQLSEICSLAGAGEEEMINIIDSFRKPGCAFLMPSYQVPLNVDSIIDISHESIMRVWLRLSHWVEEENQSAQLYLRLSKSAELYQEGKTGLWVNPELQLALQWYNQNRPNATWAMRYDAAFDRAVNFLEYSKQQYELEITRKENQQKRNLRRARNSAIILGVASLVSILFLIISLNLRFKAEASRREALEKEKLAVAESRRTAEQTKEAILQKKISLQQQEIADQQRMITEEQRIYAVKQQEIAQQQTAIAITETKRADASRQEAILSRDEAQEQRKEAVAQKQIADQQRIKAENSEKNTYRLRMLSVSQNLAITANQMGKTVKGDLPVLLAVTAWQLNKDYGGSPENPEVFTALSGLSGDQTILRGHTDAVRTIIPDKNGKKLYSAGDDGMLIVWDPVSGKMMEKIATPVKGAEGPLRTLALSADGKWLICGTASGKLIIRKTASISEPPLILPAHRSVINAIAVDPERDRFLTAGSDGRLLLWNFSEGKFSHQLLDSLSGKITCAAFTSGGLAACGTGKGIIRIINTRENNPRPALFEQSDFPVTALTFSHDGKWLAAGFSNGSFRVWNLTDKSQQPYMIYGKHISGITSMSFSTDNATLLTSGYDRNINVAAFPAGMIAPITIREHDGWVYQAIFTTDLAKVISCSADETIRITPIRNEALSETVRKKLTRNLTRDEWNRLVGSDIPYFKARTDLP